MELRGLQYPIGEFEHTGPITEQHISGWIDDIARLPEQLKTAVAGLTARQLNTPYRPNGWTLRQVVHHIADSHMNSVIRFKLALTEDSPIIKPYREDRWAELEDYRSVPIEVSLNLVADLHARWVPLLRSLDSDALDREFFHPDAGAVSLRRNIGIYAWHGKHHVAHITSLRERQGWN